MNLFATILIGTMALANCDQPLYKTAGAPISARVDDLVSRMTVDELMGQLTHRYGASQQDVEQQFGQTGLGQASMQTTLLVQAGPLQTLRNRNAFQSFFINTSRLGIPVSIAHEGLHSGGCFGTIFPQPCALGPSWNTSLLTAIGASLADQSRAYGVDNVWSPVVNLWGADGDARFGRYQEGLGPDPMMTSHMGRAIVLGLQGGNGTQQDYLPSFNFSVWSTAKHFAGYGTARGGLNGGEFSMNNRTLHEVYLRPWRSMAAIGLRGAMPSHNSVLDVPMHMNRFLIRDVLRNEFGFGNGSTVSDCSDVYSLTDFGVADNISVAAALSTLAGVDVDLWCSHASYYGVLNTSLQEGLVNLADIQENVAHLLTQKFAAGLFDSPYTDESWVSRLNPLAAQQLALEAAQQGVVLLQNSGALPLANPASLKIAMVGPHLSCNNNNESAINWFKQYGTSYGPLKPQTKAYAQCYGRTNTLGSYILDEGFVSVPLLPDAWASTFPGASISVSLGAIINDMTPRPDLVAQAVAASQAADVTIVVGGDDLETCGEWVDRDDLDLPGSQLALLEALANATNKPVILVLINGRAMSFGPGNAILGKLAGVVEAWRPGQAGAQAIVDVITGRVNPSGKLNNAWVQGVGQIGSGGAPFLSRVEGKWIANSRTAADADGRTYDPYVLSQYGNASGFPLFRFGHGLSYTNYTYKSITVTVVGQPSDSLHGGVYSGRGAAGYRDAVQDTVLQAVVQVCNTGGVYGTEVVQVYSQDPRGIGSSTLGIVSFWKRLVGFGRLPLAAGACDSLSVPILADDLAQYDDMMTLRIMPGTYTISAGGSSDSDAVQQTVQVQGKASAEERNARVSPRDRLVQGMTRRTG